MKVLSQAGQAEHFPNFDEPQDHQSSIKNLHQGI
jgi:hypothetical protein